MARAIVHRLWLIVAMTLIAASLLLLAQQSSEAQTTGPDLTVAQIGPKELYTGENNDYSIVVTNDSSTLITIPADTVLLRTTYDGAITPGVSCSVPNIGDYLCSVTPGSTITDFITKSGDTLLPGEGRSFSSSVQAPASPSTITSIATVDPDNAIVETNKGNNTATFTTMVVEKPTNYPTFHLSLTKSGAPDPVKVGTPPIYTLTATNNGPDQQPSGADISDSLPFGTAFVSAQFIKGEGSCIHDIEISSDLNSPLFSRLECRVYSAIEAGGTVAVNVVVVPQKTGVLENMGQVFAGREFAEIEQADAKVSTIVLRKSHHKHHHKRYRNSF